ncbi:MAG TPA: hypothetical protein VIJ00_15415, partial [Nakamurella sp.]
TVPAVTAVTAVTAVVVGHPTAEGRNCFRAVDLASVQPADMRPGRCAFPSVTMPAGRTRHRW